MCRKEKRRALESLEARQLLAVDLVADINPLQFPSNPSELVAFGDEYFFVARHSSANRNSSGLFRFDPATKLSERLVGNMSLFGSSLRVVNGQLFFDATVTQEDGSRRNELWVTDGTSEGTRSLHDSTSLESFLLKRESFDPSVWNDAWNDVDFGEVIDQLALERARMDGPFNLDGTIVFTLDDPESGRKALWTTDGTVAGTHAYVSDVDLIDQRQLVVGDKLYFNNSNVDTGVELWVTDGTAVGTKMVRDIVPGADEFQGARELHAAADGTLLFTTATLDTGEELWRTDGTEAGTWMVADVEPGPLSSSPTRFWNFGETTYFEAGTEATGREVWATGGTAETTRIIVDARPGPESGEFWGFGNTDQGVVFRANHTPWFSDGTEAGTLPLTEAPVVSRLVDGGQFHDRVVFAGAIPGEGGRELWITDGTTAGTYMLDVLPGTDGSDPSDYTTIGDELYFTGSPGEGRERYVTDGTLDNTQMVPSVNNSTFGSDARPLGQLPNGKAIASGDDGTHGPGLFALGMDGSVQRLFDLRSVFEPFHTQFMGDHMYFYLPYAGLLATDGTVDGTQLITDEFGLFEEGPFEVVGDHFFFPANFENSVWLVASDGTTEGTRPLKDLGDLDFFEMAEFRGQLIFKGADEVRGEELWITNGAAEGTRLVQDVLPGPDGSQINSLTYFDGSMYFLARQEDAEGHLREYLFQSDGTEGGTKRFIEERAFALVATDELLLFNVGDDAEPWRSDGTLAGTFVIPLEDVAPPNFRQAFSVGDKVYFGDRRELWVSDGTAEGTQKLPWEADRSGPVLTPWNGKLLVRVGEQLFESDGTEVGTIPIDTSGLRFVPRDVVVDGPGVYLQMESDDVGRELFLITPTVVGTPQVTDFTVDVSEQSILQSVSFEFSSSVLGSLKTDDLILIGPSGFPIDTFGANFSWNADSNIATWDLSDLILGYGVYDVELGRRGVFDDNNNVLDGNGDGIAGDSFRTRVSTAIAGDVDLNGIVDFGDFLLLSGSFRRENAQWQHGDLDGDRFVGFSDFLVLSGSFGAQREE